jgi:hypothetical protein
MPSTTTNRIGATIAERRVSQITACSTTPSVTAPAKISGRLVMPPITHAASARIRIAGPSTCPSGTPTTPARRNTATNASPAATIHTTICTRRTGMPSRLARSALSALARTAMPMSVNRKNAASAAMHSPTANMATMSLPPNTTGAISNSSPNGDGNDVGADSTSKTRGNASLASDGSARPTPANSWASPSVATVRISRGARANRRMTTTSTSAPSPTATTSPSGSATK